MSILRGKGGKMNNHIMIVDIETKPNKVMKPHLDTPTAPSNYKDPIKIESYIKEATKEQYPRCSLDIDFCRIVCLGISLDLHDPEHLIYSCSNEIEEASALEQFWEFAIFSQIIGYNLKAFDLPIILRRSFLLGIQPRVFLGNLKYNPMIIDLMELYYHGGIGSVRYRSLKKVCKMLGIPNELPDADGSKVIDMDEKEIRKYCANDITLTQALAKKMQGYYWR